MNVICEAPGSYLKVYDYGMLYSDLFFKKNILGGGGHLQMANWGQQEVGGRVIN